MSYLFYFCSLLIGRFSTGQENGRPVPRQLSFDNQHPHTRDFSRELGCFLALKIKELFQKNKILQYKHMFCTVK